MHCFALLQLVQSTGTFGGETASPWKQTESTVPTEGLGFGNSLRSGEVMEQLYELGTWNQRCAGEGGKGFRAKEYRRSLYRRFC